MSVLVYARPCVGPDLRAYVCRPLCKKHRINSLLYLLDLNQLRFECCAAGWKGHVQAHKEITMTINDFPKAAALLGAHCSLGLVSTDNSEACVFVSGLCSPRACLLLVGPLCTHKHTHTQTRHLGCSTANSLTSYGRDYRSLNRLMLSPTSMALTEW